MTSSDSDSIPDPDEWDIIERRGKKDYVRKADIARPRPEYKQNDRERRLWKRDEWKVQKLGTFEGESETSTTKTSDSSPTSEAMISKQDLPIRYNNYRNRKTVRSSSGSATPEVPPKKRRLNPLPAEMSTSRSTSGSSSTLPNSDASMSGSAPDPPNLITVDSIKRSSWRSWQAHYDQLRKQQQETFDTLTDPKRKPQIDSITAKIQVICEIIRAGERYSREYDEYTKGYNNVPTMMNIRQYAIRVVQKELSAFREGLQKLQAELDGGLSGGKKEMESQWSELDYEIDDLPPDSMF